MVPRGRYETVTVRGGLRSGAQSGGSSRQTWFHSTAGVDNHVAELGPPNVTDVEWSFAAPDLTLHVDDAPRPHPPGEVFGSARCNVASSFPLASLLAGCVTLGWLRLAMTDAVRCAVPNGSDPPNEPNPPPVQQTE